MRHIAFAALAVVITLFAATTSSVAAAPNDLSREFCEARYCASVGPAAMPRHGSRRGVERAERWPARQRGGKRKITHEQAALAAQTAMLGTTDIDLGGRTAECRKRRATAGLWCGCASAERVGLSNQDGYWDLADHWFEFPRTTPGHGAAAVRHRHVAIIEYMTGPHTAMAYDPNSGNGRAHMHVIDLRDYAAVVDPRGAPRVGSYAAASRAHPRRVRFAHR